jgi:hypothetical protein
VVDSVDDSLSGSGAMRAEVERLRREAERQLGRAERRAQFWAYADVALGFPAALLAGVSGAAGLATADARVPAALLALVSAGLSAGAGFLRSDVRRIANKRSRQAWATVEAEACLVLARVPYLSREELQQELRILFESRRVAMAAYEGEALTEPPGGQ